MMQEGDLRDKLATTVAQEFAVALSGVALVLFILAHLAGNFILFRGPDAFNDYARNLQALGAILWMMRVGLAAAFVAHVFFTVRLALANRRTRDVRYAVRRYMGGTNFVKLTMLYTGIMVFGFLLFHLRDFSLADRTGPAAIVTGQSLGLYGLVWNAFANPVHSFFYLVAVWVVGLHFSNAVATVWVTLGALTDAATVKANLAARILGVLIALGFSSIPIYVLMAARMVHE